MLRVGLTGGIGCGKTLVAQAFARQGVPVIDADEIARAVLAPGTEGIAAVRATFGPEYIRADGTLDRARLRERVFADLRARGQLEAIVHPAVRKQIESRTRSIDAPYVLIVIPLLFESGMEDLVDRILVVDCPRREQLARVTARDGVPAEQVEAIIESQIDAAERRARADDIIDNAGPPQAVEEHAGRLHERYLALARAED
jgi:dephospho-CoA kinase